MTWPPLNKSWSYFFLQMLTWRFVFTFLGVVGICIEVLDKNYDVGAVGILFLVIGCVLYIIHSLGDSSESKG